MKVFSRRKTEDNVRSLSYILKMEEIIIIAASGLLAFLVGSFPTAYILVRKQSGKDVRAEGSGNVGTLNAFEVSRSKRIGATVLVIDVLKGALPVLLVYVTLGDAFFSASAAMLGVVLGHCYSPWIGWKGGRGLAPAAGATLVFNPLLPAIWVVFWLAGFMKTRNVHFGNIAATVLSPVTVLLALDLVGYMNLFSPPARYMTPLVAAVLFALILTRHAAPLRQLISTYSQSRKT